MTNQQQNQADDEREIFLGSLECESPEQRAAFLEKACAGKPEIRLAVEALIEHHKEDTFMQQTGRKAVPLPALEQAGDRIGRYKLLQQIGEGGCGIVYMAEQEEPVRRQVALKVIKLGMDTKNVIARFEAERQALAMMDHPNIARVFDAGATETGRPYFVMELVRGVKFTDFCDQNHLPTPERLRLFIQVCHAIQHAHQKGIIHRDIKPSNILVTLRDGVPAPKVIDFGIAKATQQRLTERTLFTAFQQFIGTPAYMSPEQAELSELGVDTRSDIYSLGVLLYELLTGRTTFDSIVSMESGLDELRRVIRDEEPVRPSTRLSTLQGPDLKVIANTRKAEGRELIHLIRGDLDWIVMKALEKDRSRRYETASGLAADVQRHLNNEPVVARPPSNLYRFQKLVRRNKLAFIAAGVVNAALAIATVVAILAAVRIQHSNQQIRQAQEGAIEKLRRSYLAEARATRLSGLAGQRFASIENVQKAVAIRSGLDARNELIACLALPDLRVASQIIVSGHPHNEYASFDLNLDHYAFGSPNGDITIRDASNNLVTAVLSAPGYVLDGTSIFSPDGKYLKENYWRDSEGGITWIWNMKNQNPVIRVLHEMDDTNALHITYATDFSQDSRFFVSSSRDGSISIYDLSSGKETKRFKAAHPFSHVMFSHDDTLLACASRQDPHVEIRDAQTGRIRLTITCPAAVSSMNWSENGSRLATACMNSAIYVWNAQTGRQISVLEGDTAFVMCLAFNRAGNLIASSAYDGLIQLWNPLSGRKVASCRGSSWQLQFSADDHYLLGWQDGYRYGSLEVASGRECRQLYVPRDGSFTSVPAFSADGRILAVGAEFKAHFWDALYGKEIGVVQYKHSDDIIFEPDGHSFITVDRDDGVCQRPFERTGGEASPAYRLGKPRAFFQAPLMECASFSIDGRYLGVTEQMKGQAYLFDMLNLPAKVVLASQPMVDRIAVSPDGHWAATASWHNSILKIWDARSGNLIRTASLPDRATVAFSPDGRWLAISSANFQLWEVGSWQPVGPPEPGVDEPIENFTAFSPDSRIMARSQGHNVQLIELPTGKTLATLESPGSGFATRFQFSPDGAQLAVAQVDQQVRLWDLRLIRDELNQIHMDWDLPPYPPATWTPANGPVTLQIEPDPGNPAPGQADTHDTIQEVHETLPDSFTPLNL